MYLTSYDFHLLFRQMAAISIHTTEKNSETGMLPPPLSHKQQQHKKETDKENLLFIGFLFLSRKILFKSEKRCYN